MASRNVLVRLVADATGAKAGLRETSAELKRFGSYTAEATVKIQTEAAQANLDKLNTRLKRYQEQPHTADVKIRMGTVARQIERTELQLRQLTEKPHEVKVGVNERSFLRVRERIGKLSFGDTVGRAGGAAFAAAGLGAGAFEAIKSVTEAYNTEQGAQARVRAQLTALNISYGENAKSIDEVIQRTSALSGLTGHDLTDAFTNIVRANGNVSKSLGLVGLAADIARAKNIDVAKAGQLIAKVSVGNISALSRYGIAIKKGSTATEALGILQHKFGGQAAAYGRTQKGALDRVNVAFEHLREVIGKQLAPFITKAANATARFVRQMTSGTGAGGRFVRELKSIGSELGSVIGFLARNRHAILLAVKAWVAYRVVAVAANKITAARTAETVVGVGQIAPAVAEAEAATVTGFAGMRAAAVSMINPLAAVLAALVAIHELKPGGDINSFIGDAKKRVDAFATRLDRQAAANSTLAGGYPDGGAANANGRPRRTTTGGRARRGTIQTAAQILAGLGSAGAVNVRNLRLQESQAQRAYVTAVRQHGANSAAAIQAADTLVQSRQAVHDALHPQRSAAQNAAARRRRRRAAAGAANPAATPQDLASEHAAQTYAEAVRKYGAGSPQAIRARDQGNVANARATIQSITTRLAADLHKYGAGSQRVARDRTALARAQVRLTTATEQLTKAVKKGTDQNAALLPRLTDVAYHPISGRMQHTPTRHGLGAAGHAGVHQTIHNNITTPGGVQYPDAEAFAAALQRKLAAKGNG